MAKCKLENCDRDEFKDTSRCILHQNWVSEYKLTEEDNNNFNWHLLSYLYSKYGSEINKVSNRGQKISPSFSEFYGHFMFEKEKPEIRKYFISNEIEINGLSFPVEVNDEKSSYKKVLSAIEIIKFTACSFFQDLRDTNYQKVFFHDCSFQNKWYFKSYESFNKEFLYNFCKFSSFTFVNQTVKSKQFKECKFEHLVLSGKTQFESLLFDRYGEECSVTQFIINRVTISSEFRFNKIKIENLDIINSVFNKQVEIENSPELGSIKIKNSTFEDYINIANCKLKQFHIEFSKVKQPFQLLNCEFKPEVKEDAVNLSSTNFMDNFVLKNCKFLSGLDLSGATYNQGCIAVNLEIEEKRTYRDTYRILKSSLDKSGNVIDANNYYGLELKKYHEYLRKNKNKSNFWERFLLLIYKHSSDYGQNFYKPLKYLLYFAVGFAIINYGYEQNWLYNIFPPMNSLISTPIQIVNYISKSIIPFKNILVEGIEFLSLLFYLIFSVLIWSMILAIKRKTKR